MVIGTLEDGRKCVYDLPTEIKTAEQFKNSYMIITMTIGRRGRARSCSDSRDYQGLMVQCGTAGGFLRVPGKRWQLFDMKSLANINGRNAPTFGASAGDGLPALMMADQKGKNNGNNRKKHKHRGSNKF